MLELQGKTVLPALIDSHTHPGMVALTAGNGELAKYTLPTASKRLSTIIYGKSARENPNLPVLIIGEWANPLFGVGGPRPPGARRHISQYSGYFVGQQWA